jgi:hypothetical protein
LSQFPIDRLPHFLKPIAAVRTVPALGESTIPAGSAESRKSTRPLAFAARKLPFGNQALTVISVWLGL